MIPVYLCPGVEPRPDGVCDACGHQVAQYTRRNGVRRWEHKRGGVAGSAAAKAAGPKAAVARAANIRIRIEHVAELEEKLVALDDEHRREIVGMFRSIEAKLDELLARPAGVREWRPEHRRQADGGVSVRDQRRAAGVGRPARPRRIPA